MNQCDVSTRDNKTLEGSIIQVEIGNFLEDFKTDILGTLETQLDIMQVKQKQVEVEQNLAISCPRCRKKHHHRECLLDMMYTCTIFTKDHAMESCPSPPRLKEVFNEAEEDVEPAYLMNQPSMKSMTNRYAYKPFFIISLLKI